MSVTVKISAVLREYVEHYDALNGLSLEEVDGQTVARLLERLKIPADQVTIIFINGLNGTLDSVIHDGDRIGLFPPVGGG